MTQQQQEERDALALEIVATQGVSLPRALEIATAELARLADYAREWDRWARAVRAEVVA